MCFELYTLAPTISLMNLEEISLHISSIIFFVGCIKPNANVVVDGFMVNFI